MILYIKLNEREIPMSKIIIIEDQTMLLEMIKKTLEDETSLEVVATRK